MRDFRSKTPFFWHFWSKNGNFRHFWSFSHTPPPTSDRPSGVKIWASRVQKKGGFGRILALFEPFFDPDSGLVFEGSWGSSLSITAPDHKIRSQRSLSMGPKSSWILLFFDDPWTPGPDVGLTNAVFFGLFGHPNFQGPRGTIGGFGIRSRINLHRGFSKTENNNILVLQNFQFCQSPKEGTFCQKQWKITVFAVFTKFSEFGSGVSGEKISTTSRLLKIGRFWEVWSPWFWPRLRRLGVSEKFQNWNFLSFLREKTTKSRLQIEIFVKIERCQFL